MSDLATLLKQQMEGSIGTQLDAAVLAGDTKAARQMAKQFADLQLASAPKGPAAKTPPTAAEIKKVLETKLTWFGVDPRKTEKIMALGRMMDPTRFETPEAFADQLTKVYNEEEKKPARGANADTDSDEDTTDEDTTDEDTTDEDTTDEDETEPVRGARRTRKNGTAQPELGTQRGSGATNLRSAFQTGDIKHLPRAAADEVRRSADKYARAGGDRENKLRATFIKNAVVAHARSALIATGKFDPKSNTLKK